MFFFGKVFDLTKDVGHWQGKSRVVGGRTENYLQRISSEVKKTDHQVGGWAENSYFRS